jgi:8-oxo-dGTP pyrophosphatase MutT (NUDIX family)
MAVSIINQIICSGGLFIAKDTKRFLFLLRTQGKTANTWGLVGGKREPVDQTPHDTLMREVEEEVGKTSTIFKVVPLELFTSNDQLFQYNTYAVIVANEFTPILNEEHSGYAWCDFGSWPKPLHRGVRTSLGSRIIKTKLELLLELI